jgi:hypothetical protein
LVLIDLDHVDIVLYASYLLVSLETGNAAARGKPNGAQWIGFANGIADLVNVFSLHGKCEPFGIGLPTVQNPDHFSATIDDRTATVTPIGTDLYLAA